MNKNTNKIRKGYKFALFMCIVLGIFAGWISAATAEPQITKLELGAPVNGNNFVGMFDSASVSFGGCDGVFVSSDQTSSQNSTNPKALQTFPGGVEVVIIECNQKPATMFGAPIAFGNMLVAIDGGSGLLTELQNMQSNRPTNFNETILGGPKGPVNKDNLSLSRAIPTGTSVTYTVNMNGELPHLVGVMGGATPIITYDAAANGGLGELTILSTTIDTTNNANESFTSLSGFMIYTDQSIYGADPLQIVVHSDAWVGDMFPLLPGVDGQSAAVFFGGQPGDAGGAQGSFTAKCGSTFYGPTGLQRVVTDFFPDDELERIFGPGVTPAALNAHINNELEEDATATVGVNNFSTIGTAIEWKYTFESPVDVSIGPSSKSTDTPTETPTPSPTPTPQVDDDVNKNCSGPGFPEGHPFDGNCAQCHDDGRTNCFKNDDDGSDDDDSDDDSNDDKPNPKHPCASSILLKDSENLQDLRTFRDGILSKNLTGLGLINLYYKHSAEVTKILESDPKLKSKAANVLKELVAVVKGASSDDTVIDVVNHTIPFWLEKDVNALLDEISAIGSNELKDAISKSRASLYE